MHFLLFCQIRMDELKQPDWKSGGSAVTATCSELLVSTSPSTRIIQENGAQIMHIAKKTQGLCKTLRYLRNYYVLTSVYHISLNVP